MAGDRRTSSAKVWCRRCRKRHPVRFHRSPLVRGQWWDVDCPKRDWYVVPAMHERTGKWMPI